ncbi:LLM class flavin-dependent oxidoreductase [Daejeonella oryzae]|uniref:LLM class flavin-dependent oxidoreductase n=1 Tax=Daejeonella oryzae TaxID=1122943 RepID=UPI00041F944E|nr:LLM class flavin-dependent oxidoreductase [Daejeonella oryzae]
MNKQKLNDIKISVLDLAGVTEGHTAADTFRNSLDLARNVENWGYTRYWLAEHHNMESVASSATSVLIGHIAGGTNTLRVGSGGIMLPNHAPLVIAEQFGTLATLYPGRIDLGLGRAPGTDQITAMAIRGQRMGAGNDFLQDILELQTYFSKENSKGRVRAIPGEGLDIPIWILGSSTDSARLAGMLGLPYAFASHFAPAQFQTAIQLYRQSFKASQFLSQPYVMACVNVIAADTDIQAKRLATSMQQLFLGIINGHRRLMQPPIDSMDSIWSQYEEAAVQQMLSCSFIGGPDKIKEEVDNFIIENQLDELMITSHIYEHKERLRSYEIFANIMKKSNETLVMQ